MSLSSSITGSLMVDELEYPLLLLLPMVLAVEAEATLGQCE
jgi:hypothetical protein